MKAADRVAAGIDAVVVGASAGGVEAMLTLLPNLRAGLDAAVFVVIHLPRDRPSLLPSIFQPRCVLPVVEAEDKMPVERGTVYVAPADYHVLIDRGPSLALSADEPVHWSRPSVDVLFESAADVYGRRLLGIILTGWNRDGANGLEAVRRAGGTTIAQCPDSAQASTMPAAALEQGAADFVLTLDEIATLLAGLAGTGTARASAPAPH